MCSPTTRVTDTERGWFVDVHKFCSIWKSCIDCRDLRLMQYTTILSGVIQQTSLQLRRHMYKQHYKISHRL